jgi:hypothetical protein
MLKNTNWIILCLLVAGCKVYMNKNIHTDGHMLLSHEDVVKTDTFIDIKSKYDTLIPIMNGLFITNDSLDYSTYHKLINQLLPEVANDKESTMAILSGYDKIDGFRTRTKKWGVIDSADNIIVPFICDAVRELENEKGVFSVYKKSHGLGTGVPRYSYTGHYYFFDKNGIRKGKGKIFTIKIVAVEDFHRDKFVIENGNTFYLPLQYYTDNKEVRGSVEKSN